MAEEVFRIAFEVRFTEIDHRWGATPVAMFNYFQETAIAHSRSLGRGPAELVKRGAGWFLMRVHFRFGRRPRWGERIEAQTWPSSLAGLHARREFRILSEAGETLAEATTSWVMIDLARRRPMRLPAWIIEAYPVRATRAIEDDFEAIPEAGGKGGARGEEESESRSKSRSEMGIGGESAEDAICAERMFHVRQSDLDTNNHANSACYLDWMIETAPAEALETMEPAEIEIAYKREAVADDDLRVVSADLGAGAPAAERVFLHAIYRGEEPAPLATGRSRWRLKPSE